MKGIFLLLILAMIVLSGCPSGAGTNSSNLTPMSGNNTNISANALDGNTNHANTNVKH